MACTVLTNCTEGEVHLVGASSPNVGTVEVCISHVFSFICDDSWDSREADVVCRALGYSTLGKGLQLVIRLHCSSKYSAIIILHTHLCRCKCSSELQF